MINTWNIFWSRIFHHECSGWTKLVYLPTYLKLNNYESKFVLPCEFIKHVNTRVLYSILPRCDIPSCDLNIIAGRFRGSVDMKRVSCLCHLRTNCQVCWNGRRCSLLTKINFECYQNGSTGLSPCIRWDWPVVWDIPLNFNKWCQLLFALSPMARQLKCEVSEEILNRQPLIL